MRALLRALPAFLCAAACASAASFISGQAARAMLGNNTFTNGYGGTSQFSLGGVGGVAWSNNRLFVADGNRLAASPQNNRVVIFDTTQIPGPSADLSQFFNSYSTLCGVCGFPGATVVGQKDFTSNSPGRLDIPNATNGSLNQPVSVAVDGNVMAIADTDNNRVLVWFNIPASQTTPPNVVLGQTNFTAFQTPQPVNASSLRGPQGVWIRGGKLFVADTQNNRVLIWNAIPTQNNQAADVVLGQPNFSSNAGSVPSANDYPATAANKLYTPVSVTSDGTRLFVADLGANRILIWNSIPTSTQQPADVEIGQPDMTVSRANNRDAFCPNTGTDSNGNTLPLRCEGTLDFPRYALSDGTRLFVADSGNNRVLIYNSIPTANGAKADIVLGQPDFISDVDTQTSSSIISTAVDNTSSVDTIPSPTGLAWDGTNLYVSDPYNRRVLIFSPGDVPLPVNSVLNNASEIVRQEGVVAFGVTTIAANDTATITIASKAYTYTIKSGDTATSIVNGLVSAINANGGDANVTALSGSSAGTVYLSSKGTNLGFDAISLAASVSNTTNLSVVTSGTYLSAGTGATAAPGMIVEINAPAGTTLSDQTVSIADPPSSDLSNTLGGVQVFIDGISRPVVSASPSRVVTVLPWSYSDRNSTSITVRTQRNNGTVTISTATSANVAPANPGIFSNTSGASAPPFPAANARHQHGNPRVVVSIDGTAKTGDSVTIGIAGSRNYSYTEVAGDTLGSVVTNLVNKINTSGDPDVTAEAGGAFTRVVIVAKQSGAAGTGIGVTASVSTSAQVSATAYTGNTCCNVTADAPLTVNNPAQVNEVIQLSAGGLGVLSADPQPVVGQLFNGTVPNNVANAVNSQMGGSTAQVVSAGIRQGSYGKYDVELLVPSGLGVNPNTQVYIAQNAFISNIVTIPVGTPTGLPDNPTNPPPTVVCSYSLSSTALSYLADANSGSIGVTAPAGCAWTATPDANQTWITFSSSTSQTGNAAITFSVAANTSGSARAATLTIAGQTVTVTQAATSGPQTNALRFVPLATPCRAVDTRTVSAPSLGAGVQRDFALGTLCSLPTSAQAYAINATVVPTGSLQYITVWPAGVSRPFASTLNSYDGRIKANAALVPAGSAGVVSVYATEATDVILDVTGYFVPATDPSGLSFYPLAPCRIIDTRSPGNASIAAGVATPIAVRSSPCAIPSSAAAYSINVTAVPKAPLTYLTVWPGGQAQPATSTLNAPTGTVVANAAMVSGSATDGSLAVFSSAATDLVIDVNGYFAPPSGTGALNFYAQSPCRAFDSRANTPFNPINGTYQPPIFASGCAVPAVAQDYVFSATVVPQSVNRWLTLWGTGAQPTVSTLNAFDGAVTSNLAVVPQASGAISAFTTESSHLILDLLGYFAP